METKRIKIEDPQRIREEDLAEAAGILRQGGLVAFPTETVYGLGANALNEEAAKKIYAAKGRPSDNPLIAHVADFETVELLAKEISEAGKKLMEAYWPGPLTLVFPKSEIVPYGTTGGLETVAIRMPKDEVARTLIRLAGVPVAAPSANTSGRPSPTTADHVYQDMNGKIEMLVDGGPVGIGLESTIVDVSGDVPVMLRPGAITLEMLRETLGEVEIDPAILGPVRADVKPKAPGMKYRHYAPKAELVLVEVAQDKTAQDKTVQDTVVQEHARQDQDVQRVAEKIRELVKEKLAAGYRVGVICTDETRDCYEEGMIRSLGIRAEEETIAHNLFAVLREFDDLKADYIYSESFSTERLGQAIMNRLTKAAGYHILKV
ncbi:MAG: L-threonylcarbamoyladenylate synthase [Hungatella sp.]